ncbi:hypothetical protein BDV93DRAFT_560462 [Ceratobasidium sp. AG-I]|nr:hypothetical protein BDV93DRAFT_560462 [Ceratobasidium sp. AG-I]
MSLENESVMSSAVSVSAIESLSDDGSIFSGENGTNSATAENSESNLFDLGDGDLHIVIGGTTLETHKFLIKRFAGFRDRIRSNIMTLNTGEPGAEEFRRAFKILYASAVEGPFDFDRTTLASALLLATRYDYSALRTFAINKLENTELSAVERIRLAREFDIPSWEEPAYLELCERDEAITMSEAGVLGLEAVVHVAKIREKEQRRRGKEIDAAEELANKVAKDQSDGSGALNVSATPVKIGFRTPTFAWSNFANAKMTKEEGIGKNAEPALQPCFTGFPAPSAQTMQSPYASGRGKRIYLDVPGCDCSGPPSDGSKTVAQCKLPPCAISAFNHLQAQQLVHKSNISALETTTEQIQNAITTLQTTTKHAIETIPPAHIQISSLREDVQKWLALKRNGAATLYLDGGSLCR